jgi:membrane-bound lytic murein transglycosylase A
MRRVVLGVLSALLLVGCSVKIDVPPVIAPPTVKPTPVPEPIVAPKLEPIKPIKKIENPDFASVIKVHPKNDEEFFKALKISKEYYSKKSIQNATFKYDDANYTGKEMLASFELFEILAKTSASYEDFIVSLKTHFDLYESKNEKNSSLITGYYAPVLKGSLIKTERYSSPLYPVPKELVTANLKKFSESLPKKELVGRVEMSEYKPFFTRAEIENGALETTKPLLYLENKIDSFFLEVQGSGIVLSDDGNRLHVGYAGKNGRPYSSIGKVFTEEGLVDSDKVNMYSIREYLMSNPDKVSRILNINESFVFFKLHDKAGIYGNINLPLTAKQSVAMDSDLIPKGSLVYIKTAIPYRKSATDTAIPRSQRESYEKFFVVQDTGGAIRGGGRVDMYFGEGDEAFFYAAQMAGRGDIYLIVAKKSTEENKEK